MKHNIIYAATIIGALAGVIAAIVAVLTFISDKKTSEIPLPLEKQANQIILSLNKPIYANEKNWLIIMFNVAKEMPTTKSRESALEKVVDAALSVNDFNVAILSMRNMPTSEAKYRMITRIIDHALKENTNLDYALVAAKDCPTTICKSNELMRVIDAYFAMEQLSKKETDIHNETGLNKENKFLIQALNSISIYNGHLTVTLNSIVESADSPITLTLSETNKESKTIEAIKLGQSIIFGKYQIIYFGTSINVSSYDVWLKISHMP